MADLRAVSADKRGRLAMSVKRLDQSSNRVRESSEPESMTFTNLKQQFFINTFSASSKDLTYHMKTVVKIDGRVVSDGKVGRVTRTLQNAYKKDRGFCLRRLYRNSNILLCMNMQIFEKITIPFFVLHGEADIVTDPEISKAQYEKASTFWSLSFNGPQVVELQFYIFFTDAYTGDITFWSLFFNGPQKDNCISLHDLHASKLSGNVLNILFNRNKFMAPETHDPFLIRQESGNVYLRHDVIIPEVPLYTTRLDCPLQATSFFPVGYFVALGSMDSSIDIWDLDLLNGVLLPCVQLGRIAGQLEEMWIKLQL
ncbi:predicted protein [Arabidopsis lyrata subsp. lyrata]|uniref:Predicted protein n=1 Tax=Arabidopsis lyrata subsp. lyrata TaxID=81972 RepID=D7LPD8_ARALL|nr:predicted protein [Arabidopsis lyrata subsp. lyrata]